MKPSIIRLRALEKQLYAYLYAMTVIDFDAETVAPEGSADGRAEATEVLSRASFACASAICWSMVRAILPPFLVTTVEFVPRSG